MATITEVVERGHRIKEDLRNDTGIDDAGDDANESGMIVS
jgi:hypothetical protein